MSPGPNTIRKVSRSRAHLDFTTRPRTGNTSVSRPAAGRVRTLSLMEISPFVALANTTRAVRPKTEFAAVSRIVVLSEGKDWSTPESEVDRSRPSALTTVKPVGAAADQAIAGRLSGYRWNSHGVSPVLGGLSSLGPIYLSGDESKLGG